MIGAVLLNLVSCGTETADYHNFSGECLLGDTYYTEFAGTLTAYNSAIGGRFSLCRDPLCIHDGKSPCPESIRACSVVTDGKKLFVKSSVFDSDGPRNVIYALTPEDGSLTELASFGTVNGRVTDISCDGKYIWESQTLYACNLKTGEEWTVLERFGDVYFLRSGDFIYYADWIDDPPAIGFDENDGKEAYNSTGGIIWRTNLYLGETEKFKELPEYCIIPTQTYYIGGKIIFGYENTDYSNYTVDNDWYNYDTVRGWLILSPEDGNATDIVNTADLYQN